MKDFKKLLELAEKVIQAVKIAVEHLQKETKGHG